MPFNPYYLTGPHKKKISVLDGYCEDSGKVFLFWFFFTGEGGLVFYFAAVLIGLDLHVEGLVRWSQCNKCCFVCCFSLHCCFFFSCLVLSSFVFFVCVFLFCFFSIVSSQLVARLVGLRRCNLVSPSVIISRISAIHRKVNSSLNSELCK